MSETGKALLTVMFCFLMTRTASAEEVIRSIGWRELASANKLSTGTVVDAPDGAKGPSLRMEYGGAGRGTFHLVTIEKPGIRTARYALRGKVRHGGVPAGSHLEMWSHFAEGAFFSRLLDRTGPMRSLEGTSEWRSFVLPFLNREGNPPPEKLVFNLVMTGAGTVEIGPVELVQFDAGEDLFAGSAGWWSDRQAGLIGGIIGSAFGIMGAIIGWLGSTGRAKGFVLGTLKAMAILGIGALALGGLALMGGQPYAVYYPLLLIGTISAALGLWLPRSMNKRYQELELRRMRALDT